MVMGDETSRPTTQWTAAARPLVEEAIRVDSVPGMVIAVARGQLRPEYLVVGTDAAGKMLTADSLFPVASITKLATALAVLRLVSDGALALDDPLARYLPDAASAREDVTLRALLCHTAGLPDDVAPEAAPYDHNLNWLALARACLVTPAIRPPGTYVHYSNLGPGLLAVVVERATGQAFVEALSDLVLTPLGIEGYLGVEPPRPPARVTGALGEHAGTNLEPFNSAFWRSLALPWGGMLSTPAGAIALARAFGGIPEGFLPGDLRAEATRDQTRGLPGEMVGIFRWRRCPWGLGAELRGDKDPHWTPAAASPGSFGHVGASGCIVWCDPAAGITWAILGTRTFESWWKYFAAISEAILTAGRDA